MYANNATTAAKASDSDTLGGVSLAALRTDLVPPGTIIWWWRPNGNFPVPSGYVICDGRPIDAGPMKGQNTPNLLGRFPRGVSEPSQIGTTGGSASYTFSHTHGFSGPTGSSGSHSHALPAHNHVYANFANWDACHSYTFNSSGAQEQFFWRSEIWAYATEQPNTTMRWYADTGNPNCGMGNPGDEGAANPQPLYTQSAAPAVGNTGDHAHSLPATGSALTAATTIQPPYVGLLPLMRM